MIDGPKPPTDKWNIPLDHAKELARYLLNNYNHDIPWTHIDLVEQIIHQDEPLSEGDSVALFFLDSNLRGWKEPVFRFTGTFKHITRDDYDQWIEWVQNRFRNVQSLTDEDFGLWAEAHVSAKGVTDSEEREGYLEEFRMLVLDLDEKVKEFEG